MRGTVNDAVMEAGFQLCKINPNNNECKSSNLFFSIIAKISKKNGAKDFISIVSGHPLLMGPLYIQMVLNQER